MRLHLLMSNLMPNNYLPFAICHLPVKNDKYSMKNEKCSGEIDADD